MLVVFRNENEASFAVRHKFEKGQRSVLFHKENKECYFAIQEKSLFYIVEHTLQPVLAKLVTPEEMDV